MAALTKRQEAELEVVEFTDVEILFGVTKMHRIMDEHIRETAHLRQAPKEVRLREFRHAQSTDREYIGRKTGKMELTGDNKKDERGDSRKC